MALWGRKKINLEVWGCVLFSLVMLLQGSAFASNASYYLSTMGNNSNSGTSTTAAWATLDYACTQLRAGDTLYVADGTYSNQKCVPANSGSETAPIKVTAFSGDPTFDGNYASDAGIAFNLYGRDYWIIEGLSIDEYTIGVYMRNSIGCAANDNTFYHQYTSAVSFVDATSCAAENNTISNVRWNSIQVGGTTLGSSNILIKGNDVSEGTEHGLMDFMNNFNHVTVENNNFHDSPWPGLYIHQTHVDGYVNSGWLTIKGNTFTNVAGFQFDDPVHNITISDNVIHDIKEAGSGGMYLRIYDAAIACNNVTISGNTLYGDAYGYLTYFKVDGLLLEGNSISGTFGDTEIRFLGGSTEKNVLRDTYTTEVSYGVNDAGYGYTVEYSGGRMFKSSGLVPRYYPTKSSVTKKATGNASFTYYPAYASPAFDYLEIIVNNINKETDTWDFTVSSTVAKNPTTFTLETKNATTVYSIRRDGIEIATASTDSTGKLTYSYQANGNEYDTNHTFNFVSIR